MAINVYTEKNNNENSISLIRKFSRKARNAGFMQALRARRFFNRKDSDLRRKQGALAKIKSRAYYERLQKLGKIAS
ncbi:MAG: ribosomal protein S21 [Planctomycetota bacterium]|jgi:ribosomal protein S21